MGLTIKGSFKGSPEYDGGYSTFYCLRENVAKAVMGDKYYLYEEWRKTDYSTPLDELHEICQKIYDFGEAFYVFITTSDCNGSINHRQCKELYEQIKDIDGDFSFSYGAYRHDGDENDIKKLLKECYSHRARLIWY